MDSLSPLHGSLEGLAAKAAAEPPGCSYTAASAWPDGLPGQTDREMR